MDRVGPAITQAFLLARYQALGRIGKEVVEVNEGDVISQKPSSEEERIMVFNVSVVSALEDIFSWMNKDRTSRTSRLSFVESWRFHRAVYRAWIMSTLYGHGRVSKGKQTQNTSTKIQKAFLSKFTSQELIQLGAVCRFLRYLASWVALAECRSIGSTDAYDFDSLYLFAGPHIVLRCFEEQSFDPLPMGHLLDMEDFLLPPLESILSQRNVTAPLGFGAILDDVRGANDICHACGRKDSFLPPDMRCTANLYNECNWSLLKANFGNSHEVFLKLASNQVERSLFKILGEADYDAFIDELFTHKSEPYQNWTRQDWICSECFQEFFICTVFRWWRARKAYDDVYIMGPGSSLQRVGGEVPKDCKHGYFCRDQCFDQGLAHAKRFNHACMPADKAASLAHYHGN